MRVSALYLDNNATTPVLPEVLEAMLPYFTEQHHNPSSPYPAGERTADAIRAARTEVARLVGASPGQITFTSGGSESISTAIQSAVHTTGRRRIIHSSVEHSAVVRGAAALGEAVTIPVDSDGRLDHDLLLSELDDSVALVSLMLVNNETGVLTDLTGIGEACRAQGALLHIDAVQGPGKLEVDLPASGAHLATLSAHKLHGPKGVGALFISEETTLSPLVHGGPQESERRAGTENVPGIVGFGRAAALARRHVEDATNLSRTAGLRDQLEAGVLKRVPGARAHGAGSPRVGNTSNILIPAWDARTLLLLLSEFGVEASAGSACNAHSSGPSPVLLAMGCSEEEASRSLRFSLSRQHLEGDVVAALEALEKTLETLEALG